jgi:hypothetical protein
LNIEERLTSLEKRIQKLEDSFSTMGSGSARKPQNIEARVVSKIEEIETQILVIIALRLKPRQTKAQVKSMLQDWGAKVGSWFDGGNLNTRMVNNGIVKKEETDKGVLFSLTKKGEFMADEMISKISQKTEGPSV